MAGDPSYALGVLRQSSVGFEVDMTGSGRGGAAGGIGKRFPVWAMGVSEGGVGA